jgi:hypothetical protein
LTAAALAKRHPIPYGHWYIDGGELAGYDSILTCISYGALQPTRTALLARIHSEIELPGMGPESLRSSMAQLRPSDLGKEAANDQVLKRFQLNLLTEGSGTQIFSTTFAQWAARRHSGVHSHSRSWSGSRHGNGKKR